LYDPYGGVSVRYWNWAADADNISDIGQSHLFTGRELDLETYLQLNRHRFYASHLGRWLTRDPVEYWGDTNLYAYLGGMPTYDVDPSGLSPWKGIATILGKKWTEETSERAGKVLATELLERLAKHRPDDQKAMEILGQLKAMGWVEGTLDQGSKAGKTLAEGGGLILREMENGKRTGRLLEWYPGEGPHHADPHWKFSSAESGTLRTIGTTVGAIAIAAIPGAEQALAGDPSGAARQFAYEVSPIGWGSWITCYFTWMYDWANDGIRGEEAQREWEENGSWINRKSKD
jgi:RHS repeat-associated protein